MSLIILKNTDSQASNRFGNDFVNTITINKNSEVALHSISFNRLDGYAVNNFFFLHLPWPTTRHRQRGYR